MTEVTGTEPTVSDGTSTESNEGPKKRSQRPFPATTFEEAASFAKAMYDFASGQPVRRLSLFNHIGKSPESGPSRQLITNAGKYGLIKGSYKADLLELTPDGFKSVGDEFPAREQSRSRIKLAITDIEPFNEVYQRFANNKLPVRSALLDAIREAGVSNDLAEEAVDTLIVNLRYTGLLQMLSGAERIITEEHLLESLPAKPLSVAPQVQQSTPLARGQSMVTADIAQFEATCFYITPIGDVGSDSRKHSDLFMGSFIEPALEQFQLSVVRADQIDKPGVITRQIIDYIVKSRIVIADLSYHNPNVFYELAIRHAVRKPVIQIIRAADRIPFDINQMRTVVIDTTDIYSLLPKVDVYRSEIAAQVRRALDTPEETDTPISLYYPNMSVSFG